MVDNKEINNLVDFALTRNDLPSLTEAVSKFLKNPIAVYDCGYYILSYSSLRGVTDEVWLAGMKRRYCSFEYASAFTSLARTSDSDSQFITHFGTHRRRMSVLRMGKSIVGYYSVIEHETPFEDIPSENYALAAKLLAKEISHYYQDDNSSSFPTHHLIITDILNGQFANEELLNQRVSGTELDLHTRFQLVTIEMDNYNGKKAQREAMNGYFKTVFPSSWSNYYHHTIIILLDTQSSRHDPKEAFPRIADYIRSMNMRACISDKFDSLFALKSRYQNTLDVLSFSKKLGNKKPLIFAEKYKPLLMVSKMDPGSADDACVDTVMQIFLEDTNDNNLLETFFIYLHFNKSLKKSSEYLYVHRNTIAYRIQKLCEKFSISFENGYENILYYFSCLILFYHRPSLREKLKKFVDHID